MKYRCCGESNPLMGFKKENTTVAAQKLSITPTTPKVVVGPVRIHSVSTIVRRNVFNLTHHKQSYQKSVAFLSSQFLIILGHDVLQGILKPAQGLNTKKKQRWAVTMRQCLKYPKPAPTHVHGIQT